MTRRCTSSCEGGQHSLACLFAAMIESPEAKPVETGWDWPMPFCVVEHPAMPPGVVMLGSPLARRLVDTGEPAADFPDWREHDVVTIRLDHPEAS